MREGRIIEDGSPELLLARRGAYYALLQKERLRLVDTAAAAH